MNVGRQHYPVCQLVKLNSQRQIGAYVFCQSHAHMNRRCVSYASVVPCPGTGTLQKAPLVLVTVADSRAFATAVITDHARHNPVIAAWLQWGYLVLLRGFQRLEQSPPFVVQRRVHQCLRMLCNVLVRLVR